MQRSNVAMRFCLILTSLFSISNAGSSSAEPSKTGKKAVAGQPAEVLVLEQTGGLFGDQTLYCHPNRFAFVNRTFNTTMILDGATKQVYFYNEKKKVCMIRTFDKWQGDGDDSLAVKKRDFSNEAWTPVQPDAIAGLSAEKYVLRSATAIDKSGRAAWFDDQYTVNQAIQTAMCKDFGLPFHPGLCLRLVMIDRHRQPYYALNTLSASHIAQLPPQLSSPSFAGYKMVDSKIDVIGVKDQLNDLMKNSPD